MSGRMSSNLDDRRRTRSSYWLLRWGLCRWHEDWRLLCANNVGHSFRAQLTVLVVKGQDHRPVLIGNPAARDCILVVVSFHRQDLLFLCASPNLDSHSHSKANVVFLHPEGPSQGRAFGHMISTGVLRPGRHRQLLCALNFDIFPLLLASSYIEGVPGRSSPCHSTDALGPNSLDVAIPLLPHRASTCTPFASPLLDSFQTLLGLLHDHLPCVLGNFEALLYALVFCDLRGSPFGPFDALLDLLILCHFLRDFLYPLDPLLHRLELGHPLHCGRHFVPESAEEAVTMGLPSLRGQFESVGCILALYC
mmetsp:Transcript_37510/g.88141  ORF Transcript_37510/g.88141 Transcript_37510/m.88141 type:complete len:307 (-) Transcript_37510:141-1061(-)